MVSPDNLIPADSELGQLLLQLSGDTDDRVWKIANITNDVIAEFEGGVVGRKDVYRAIAARCKGRKINTIRRWAEVAADYDEKLQGKYAQLLSFEHFKTSRRLFNEGYTPGIEYGLQWCVEGNDEKLNAGKFHTVGEMINHFVPEFREQGPGAVWNRVKDDLYDNFLLLDNDTDRERLLDAWSTIDFVLDKKQKL
jgi:hypothetical protein